MKKLISYIFLILSFTTVCVPQVLAQSGLVKGALETGSKAAGKSAAEKKILQKITAAEMLQSPVLSVGKAVDPAWQNVQMAGMQWKEAQVSIKQANQIIAQSNEMLNRYDLQMGPDGRTIFATSKKGLAFLRRHVSTLDTEKAFVVTDLSKYRPKTSSANTHVAFPEEFQQDLGTRYLGFKYIGMRVNAQTDINAFVQELKTRGLSEKTKKVLENTENPVIIDDLPYLHGEGGTRIWLKHMDGLEYQLTLSDEQQYNDFVPSASPVPYQVVGLIDTGFYLGFDPYTLEKQELPSVMKHILMQLEVEGKVVWCEIIPQADGKIKVIPYK